MKKILLIFFLALVALTGCKKDPAPEQNQNPNVFAQNANCYIVSKAGTYSFIPTKGGSSAVEDIHFVRVLWESYGTDIAPAVGDLVHSVSFSDNKITFTATDKKGNAVIAARDASSRILWTWHIWMTDEPEECKYANGAGVMMDRNLGATSAEPGDVGALGLLYQWGRKDPFLGSSSISSSTLANSTIIWPSAVSSNSSNGTIAYATANPTTFIAYNSSNLDWYFTGSTHTDNTRWTTSEADKSIYDPCPAGWRVPDGGNNGVWSKTLGSSKRFGGFPYDSSNEGMNFSGKFGADQTIWYPASGYRSYYDGSLDYVGDAGGYWSASLSSYRAYLMDLDSDGFVTPSSDNSRASGQSVRCVKE